MDREEIPFTEHEIELGGKDYIVGPRFTPDQTLEFGYKAVQCEHNSKHSVLLSSLGLAAQFKGRTAICSTCERIIKSSASMPATPPVAPTPHDTNSTPRTTQFQGESDWDAIVNHNSLDIEEESDFEEYVKSQGASKDAVLEMLETLYKQWRGR